MPAVVWPGLPLGSPSASAVDGLVGAEAGQAEVENLHLSSAASASGSAA